MYKLDVMFGNFCQDGSYGEIEATGPFKVPVRALNIIWCNDTRFWRFMDLPEDETTMIGFKEGAVLVQVNWIEVTGKVPKTMLHRPDSASAPTRYEIVCLMKFRADAFGWHPVPIKFKLRLTNKPGNDDHNTIDYTDYDEKSIILEPYREKQEVWHEIPAGHFSVSNPDGFLEFGVFEVDTTWWKGNTVTAGVKIKPIRQA